MKKILVIEDNADVRENIEELLELSGYTVHTAENGRIGADLAIKTQPDLIVCDIMMPVLDGFGVLRILSKRPETASIPFIFLTAKTEHQDFRKGMRLGADDYLTKPFDDVELLDAIELRLKKSERLQQNFEKTPQSLDNFFQAVKGLEAFQELSENREVRHYRKKDIIYEEGAFPKQLFFIHKGRVKTYKTNEFGKELIVEVFQAGSFLGYIPLIQNGTYQAAAAAMENCELSIIPKDDFLLLMNNDTNVTAQLVKMLADSVVEKEQQLLDLAYNSVRRKVADALLQLAGAAKEDKKVSFSILREDLAGMAGTAKETVIRMLSEFKEDGIINIKGSRITILSRADLEDMPY